MAKTIARSSAMGTRIVFRGTEKDKARIVDAARASGMDLSNFLRQLLIREGVITPLG